MHGELAFAIHGEQGDLGAVAPELRVVVGVRREPVVRSGKSAVSPRAAASPGRASRSTRSRFGNHRSSLAHPSRPRPVPYRPGRRLDARCRRRIEDEVLKALTLGHEIKTAAPDQPVILAMHEMKHLAHNAAELMARSAQLRSGGVQLELLAGPLTGMCDPHGIGLHALRRAGRRRSARPRLHRREDPRRPAGRRRHAATTADSRRVEPDTQPLVAGEQAPSEDRTGPRAGRRGRAARCFRRSPALAVS
jgi:hypothetical protein